jgi:ankyrin repeat protein
MEPSLQTALSSPSTPSQNLNALQKAVIKGRYNIAQLLVENGADVYAVDDYGNNILHLAAQFGHAPLISFALSHCPNINDINLAGDTPLHMAIEHNHPEIVQILIRAGADMEFKSY